MRKIDVLILSHADEDHIGGALSVITSQTVVVKAVYLNTDSVKGTAAWEDLLCALQDYEKRGDLVFQPSVTPNLNGRLDRGNITVEILAPSNYLAAKGPGSIDRKGRRVTSNSMSVVVRVSTPRRPVAIFPGDLDVVGLQNLLEDRAEVKAWLAAFPHHGGLPGKAEAEPFVSMFCTSVSPQVIVFSIGGNQSASPRRSIIEAIERTSAETRMYTTGSSQVLKLHIQGKTRCPHKDCVGDISLDLDTDPPTIKFEKA